MKPVRLGVIGLGLIWIREHRNLLQPLRDFFEPVAFCDVREERRMAVAQEYPGATVVESVPELLALPDVDAVLVLTPIALNAPTAMAALEAGKHVIMEKPIARSVEEGRALIATAQRMGRRLDVTEQFVYRVDNIRLAETVASGAIGELVVWEAVRHLEADTGQGVMRYASTLWRQQADYPLGTMFDGGIHLVAGLTQVFSVPQTLFATGKQMREGYGDYDHVAVTFQYETGYTGMLSYSAYLPPQRNNFHIYGTEGVLSVEDTHLLVERNDSPARYIELPGDTGRANMWRAIAAAYHEGIEPYYTPQRALQDVAILEAVDRSIRQKAAVPVECIQ